MSYQYKFPLISTSETKCCKAGIHLADILSVTPQYLCYLTVNFTARFGRLNDLWISLARLQMSVNCRYPWLDSRRPFYDACMVLQPAVLLQWTVQASVTASVTRLRLSCVNQRWTLGAHGCFNKVGHSPVWKQSNRGTEIPQIYIHTFAQLCFSMKLTHLSLVQYCFFTVTDELIYPKVWLEAAVINTVN